MRAHPWLVAGTDREDTVAMRAVPGLLSKVGAEAVWAMALPDGTALALKLDDGTKRGCAPLGVAVLRHLGVDVSELAGLAAPAVLGGGREVGRLKVSWSAP